MKCLRLCSCVMCSRKCLVECLDSAQLNSPAGALRNPRTGRDPTARLRSHQKWVTTAAMMTMMAMVCKSTLICSRAYVCVYTMVLKEYVNALNQIWWASPLPVLLGRWAPQTNETRGHSAKCCFVFSAQLIWLLFSSIYGNLLWLFHPLQPAAYSLRVDDARERKNQLEVHLYVEHLTCFACTGRISAVPREQAQINLPILTPSPSPAEAESSALGALSSRFLSFLR